ncbi:hypothetical protein A4D02_25455 [Niastella koreensis]|uniref:Uncharacterized protein n=2 Tax=Niastella koreensis TaxID=354356 RepID=G8TNK3_NIAKG|nr:hypothetical protein [Niastella koreensis]AEV99920.1 hypothetical protein Niako_3620 [Niastella koreensis GR20-10]OQP51472.1 hypothetical protein A4D02_25455 [Niastella koreensis]
MRITIVFVLLNLSVTWLYSQTPVYPKEETYKFLFFEGMVSDTNKLNLKVKYINKETDTILVHMSLIEGTKFDPFANVYTELQKNQNGKYNQFVDKHVDYYFGDSTPDPKRVYIKLKPGDSTELNFNLISRIGAFYKGKYRMRVHLLKTPLNVPPVIPRQYAISRWFYFEVVKDMDYHDLY